MYSRINYTVVGLFVVLFSAAVMGFGFWLAKYGFEQKYDRYYLYFREGVDGLTLDSSVKLKGVDVGKVSAIDIDPENVENIRVLIRLEEGTPVTEGMYGILKLQGITGLSYVQIEGGRQGEKRLHPSDDKPAVIPTRESLIQQLGKAAPNLLEKLDRAVGGLDAFLSKHNRKQWTNILDNSVSATGKAVELEEKIIRLSKDFNRTMKKVEESFLRAGNDIHAVSRTLNAHLEPLMKHLKDAGRHISELSRGIDKRMKRGEYDFKRIIRPLKTDLQELSYRYQELAEDLKHLSRSPSDILFDSTTPMKGPGE